MTAPADFDRALDATFPLTPAERALERRLLAAIDKAVSDDKKRIAAACAGRKTLEIGSAMYGRGERR